jgi:hypothetical protein
MEKSAASTRSFLEAIFLIKTCFSRSARNAADLHQPVKLKGVYP